MITESGKILRGACDAIASLKDVGIDPRNCIDVTKVFEFAEESKRPVYWAFEIWKSLLK